MGFQIERKRIKEFQSEILSWYVKNKRDLPWRRTRDPYRILVSEVMLQQTQVSRVMSKYEAWLEVFPTAQDLALAKTSEVLRLWSGLGYNRRALNLKKAAEIITEEYAGTFPRDEKKLLQLPGIGQYTARAVLCFAFDEQVAVVDTNVRKILLTRIKKQELRSKENKTRTLTDKQLWQFAEEILPVGRAYDWNQALMDYAAVMLKQEKILIPKQSKFIGSHRYYRGKVLKVLLEKGQIAVEDLGLTIKDDYAKKDAEWLDGLVKELAKDGFVRVEDETVILES